MLSPLFVEQLEAAVWAAAQAHFGDRCRRRRELVESIGALSAAYAAGQPPRGETHLLARLVFFTLADLPKVAFPLAELAQAGCLPERPLRLLDVGAGCGTLGFGVQGMLAELGLPAPELTCALDLDAAALRLAADVQKRGAAALAPGGAAPALKTFQRDLRQASALAGLPGPFDLIVAGNVLTELPSDERRALSSRLLTLLAPDGAVILLEPALRASAQALGTLRDELLAADGARIFAPCTHDTPCPLAQTDDAWCHELRIWQLPPPELRQLAAASNLRRRDLKFSYLTLRAPETSEQLGQLPPAGARGRAYRCVGSVQRSKGKRDLWLCGEGGRVQALRLDRHRKAPNRPFERLGRGRLVWFDSTGDAPTTSIRIDQSTTVFALDPTDRTPP